MIFATTERLILRACRDEDFAPLMRYWSDPGTMRYLQERPDPGAFVADLIAEMQAKAPGDQEPGPWYQFIVERRSDGAVVGDLAVGFGVPGERQAELGYRIQPTQLRQGYAREAMIGLIDFLVVDFRIHRFVAVAAMPNTASTGLLRALGFRKEGHFRQSFFRNGEWLDDEYFALLAEEWLQRDR